MELWTFSFQYVVAKWNNTSHPDLAYPPFHNLSTGFPVLNSGYDFKHDKVHKL